MAEHRLTQKIERQSIIVSLYADYFKKAFAAFLKLAQSFVFDLTEPIERFKV